MVNKINISKNKLNKIILESIEEVGIDKWNDDDFVNWDELQSYCVDGDTQDRNYHSAIKKGFTSDELCPICSKPLKKSYKQLYIKDPSQEEWGDRGSSSRFYAKPGENRNPKNIGNTCIKHLETAYDDIYGKLDETIQRVIRKKLKY